MFKRQLKNWSLVLTLLMTMLALPSARWAFCASCAMHQEESETDEHHCCDQIAENHCPPESGSVHQDTHYQAQTNVLNDAAAKIQNGCFCLRDNRQQQTVSGQQKIQPQHFYSVVSPAQFSFPFLPQTTALVFFKPIVVYPARSALLSDLPARAPPAL